MMAVRIVHINGENCSIDVVVNRANQSCGFIMNLTDFKDNEYTDDSVPGSSLCTCRQKTSIISLRYRFLN